MDKLDIETSIVSYATARPSRDITIAGLQQQARDWWENERHQFELVTSMIALVGRTADVVRRAKKHYRLTALGIGAAWLKELSRHGTPPRISTESG